MARSDCDMLNGCTCSAVMSKYEMKSQCRMIRLDSVKHQHMNDSRHGDLLGKVEWFLMLETKAQDFVIGKIDAAVFVNVEFIPTPTLGLLEI
jgi:hypothetical protein